MALLPALLPWERGGGNLAGQDTGREHLSHTGLSAFLACPQKYAYTYVDRLEPIRRSDALTLGKAFQLAVEHEDPVYGARSLREHAIVYSQDDEDRLRANEAIVLGAAGLYLDRYPQAREQVAHREYEYRVRLRNPWNGYLSRTFDLLGYADEIVDQGDHWLLIENKLVGQITETHVRKLPLDRQVALAAYGVWRATGKPVREVAYRFTRKPSIRRKQNEPVDDYCTRILEDYATRSDFYAHEETWIRSTEDLVRMEVELWEWAARLRNERSAPVWTRNTATCTDYGGCPFIPLCLGESPEGLFVKRPTRHVGVTDRKIETPASLGTQEAA